MDQPTFPPNPTHWVRGGWSDHTYNEDGTAAVHEYRFGWCIRCDLKGPGRSSEDVFDGPCPGGNPVSVNSVAIG